MTDRRTFVKTGSLFLSGLGLSNISLANDSFKDKSVIFIFLAGGATHYETFTAIPTAKDKYRSVIDYVPTKHGFHLGGLWEKISGISDYYSVVHSFTHSNAGHQSGTNWVHTGYNFNDENQGAIQKNPSIGSIFSRSFGANNPKNGIPTYIVLSKIFGQNSAYLGNAYNPFTFDEEGKKSLTLSIDPLRFSDRKNVLTMIDNRFNKDKNLKIADSHKKQAFDILSGDINKSFEISLESQETKKLYGDNAFAKQLMLARRLVQSGSRFVSAIHGGWDNHTDIQDALGRMIPEVDHALYALITDLKNNGMLDTTMVVVTTEFGRTPLNTGNDGQGNIRKPGRDHAPGVTPLLIAGGNYQGKGAIGKVDSNGFTVTDNPYQPIDLLHTILNHVNIDTKTQFVDLSGRPRYIIDGESRLIT